MKKSEENNTGKSRPRICVLIQVGYDPIRRCTPGPRYLARGKYDSVAELAEDAMAGFAKLEKEHQKRGAVLIGYETEEKIERENFYDAPRWDHHDWKTFGDFLQAHCPKEFFPVKQVSVRRRPEGTEARP